MKVVAAAIQRGDLIFSVPPPGRHNDIIHAMVMSGIASPITGDQGFLLSDGSFANRVEALDVAIESGQYTVKGKKFKLYSEDLW